MERKKYLVCVDSDGCAMDTMNVKHKVCFGPELLNVWDLEPWRTQVLNIWDTLNLYSRTRGINRFLGLELALSTYSDMGMLKEDISDLTQWVHQSRELSNQALEQKAAETKSPILLKALDWSRRVNQSISRLPKDDKPFPGVREGLEEMSRAADIVIVSSANREAVEAEWSRHGLTGFVKEIMTQDMGSKAHCIGLKLEDGYDRTCALMVGDAPGDLLAAQANDAAFYPILPGNEEFSWKRLRTEAFKRLMEGTYQGEYQNQRIAEFEDRLK
ncbi:HAD hydrolase-like protein [Clostridium sp. MCC353]|uniref:HAD family hydrolase n=1 Tax=Clostridium sp. MCC353 TaxID=2592646 RepID=UPI001C034B60|nr:HAD hydrolase-like protein [Clostridium sp. MCC353]MBT9779472.1 HAD hydrolase-like protein [Clostridium sp. MCC353]